MIDRDRPIAIVGAGIAGLTAALCFAKVGFRVEVFERADELADVGAGLQLSPNALRVLSAIGVAGDLTSHGVAASSVTLRSGRTGRWIAQVPVVSTDGTAYLSIHRADLQAALVARTARNPLISLHLGHELTDISTSMMDNPRETGFAVRGNETVVQRSTPLLVAADGVHSRVAERLGLRQATRSGVVAWRMTIERPADTMQFRGIEAWLGPGRHAVAYPIRGGREINLVLIERERDPDHHRDRSDLLFRFRNWDRRLLAMIEAAGTATAWPLLTADRSGDALGSEGVLLIGDAAHAMLPYAAQGAAMAIEDAAVAAHVAASASASTDVQSGFRAARAERLRHVLRRVAFHRFVYHLPWPASLARDLVLGLRSEAALRDDLAWLYDWSPPGFDPLKA